MESRRSNKRFLVAFILIALIIFTNAIKAQPFTKDLRVMGGSVNFLFSTLNHYENGITLSNGWTKIRIRYRYAGQDPWEIRVNALDNVIKYEGAAANDIPISQLELIVTITSSNDGSSTVTAPFVLSNLEQAIVKGNGLVPPAIVDVEISINYRLGFPPNIMLNKPDGLYYVGLRFLLREQ